MLSRDDLLYIAGFFDGEGDAQIVMRKSGKNGKRYATLAARLTQCDRSVLVWVSQCFQFGNVYAKTVVHGHTQCHAYQLSARQARVFLTAIEPHLKVKREHVRALLDRAGREPEQVAELMIG